MIKTDPRIDAYIDQSAEFARPILRHLRSLVRQTCPDVEETIKWRSPHFLYGGQLLCSMAAFKQHCAFGFWREHELFGANPDKSAMGQFGRIASVKDLPSDRTIIRLLKQAMQLNDDGAKPIRAAGKPKAELLVPADLLAALKKNKNAAATFDGFSDSNKREYVD